MARPSRNTQNTKLDMTNFNRMVNILSKEAEVQPKIIIRSEMNAVIKKCIKETKQSTLAMITKRYKFVGSAKDFKPDKNTGKFPPRPVQSEDLIPYIAGFGKGKKFDLRKDVTADNLQGVKAYLRAAKAKRVKRIGFSKAMFVILSKMAGLTPKVPFKGAGAKAATANPEIKKYVSFKEEGKGVSYTFKFDINSRALYAGTGGKRTVKYAIQGREKYFANNVMKGMFKKPKSFADKYGFVIQP